MRVMWRVLGLLAICLGVAAEASAQYRFDTWTTENGLPQNGVREITQTPDGYLWFTTFDGLVRFDGIRFTTFSSGNTKGIINNRFTGLYRSADGVLYATTMEDGILTVYRDGEFTSYTSAQVPGHYIQRIEPNASGELRFLVEDEDRASKSWYFLRDGKFEFDEKDDPNKAVTLPARNGVTWTVSSTEAIERRAGTSTRYPLAVLPFRPNVFVDRTGRLWLGGYVVQRLGSGRVRTVAGADGLTRSIHHSFWEEPDGSVWFASGGGATEGVGIVRVQDDRVQRFGAESGLKTRSIWSVFHDREGTTWLATDKGLARMRQSVFEAFSVKDGLIHSEVYPIYRDHLDRIWIGTSKGLSRYENGHFTPFEPRTADPHAPFDETWRSADVSVQSLWEDPRGRMWVGINGGIYIIEHDVARALVSAKGHHVFAIHGDRRGQVWAATNKGMLLYRDLDLVRRVGVNDGLPNEFMTTIFEDSKGTLWFGGFGGLTRFADEGVTNYTTRDGLTGSYVRSIYEDGDGVLWIGTYDEGLSRFKDGRFASFKVEHGLFNNGVFAIQEDARGNFWISSNRGIYRAKKQELNAFADGRLPRIHSVGYGREDGMLSTECNGGRQPASITDRDGRFWFPTQDGVVIIEPRNERDNALPPAVVIESASVERAPANIRHGLTIEPGRRDVEINFAGVSLIKSEQIKFRYRLDGYDRDWIDAGTRRTAYYSYLPPGDYRFVVTAANSDDVWNEAGAALAVVRQPFFYETRSFVWLSIAGASALLFVGWKLSVRRLQARQRELARLVDERTEALRLANAALAQRANIDALTGVANRHVFDEFLGDEWRRAIRFKTPIALLLIDIDHFKAFNDSNGHLVGDACLKDVADALRQTIHRPTDLLARFGGEEFAVVLGGTELRGARTVAQHALRSVRNTPVTVSIGVAALLPHENSSPDDLIRLADEALYGAKAAGRDQVKSAAGDR